GPWATHGGRASNGDGCGGPGAWRRAQNGTARLKTWDGDSTGALIGGRSLVETVTVEVRMGILRDRVLVDRHEYEILRGRDGWRHVVDRGCRGGLVRFGSCRDRIDIVCTYGFVQNRTRW